LLLLGTGLFGEATSVILDDLVMAAFEDDRSPESGRGLSDAIATVNRSKALFSHEKKTHKSIKN
jgi:hypothetical protein